MHYVPEPHTDSIAVVLGERFGLVGWALLVILFLLLAWRGLAIAQATREPFGRLVAIGIVALLATQVLINLGMLVGLLPITGPGAAAGELRRLEPAGQFAWRWGCCSISACGRATK